MSGLAEGTLPRAWQASWPWVHFWAAQTMGTENPLPSGSPCAGLTLLGLVGFGTSLFLLGTLLRVPLRALAPLTQPPFLLY